MITTGQKIAIQRTTKSRLPETDLDQIKFGRTFSDHMVVMDYRDGAWQAPTIVPFGDLRMSPATLVLHYSQTIFEGLKAYKGEGGQVNLFRPQANIARMNRSTHRMCMPHIPEDVFLEALVELVRLDKDWIPQGEEAAMYIRPFMFASDEYIGVRPSESYRFMIFTCPVRGYYKEAVRVKIETEYSRAFPGGTGTAKCGGNYAGALYPAKLGQDKGFHQLVWTDAKEHRFIEESGTMNIFFHLGDKLVTPALSGTILDGITRDSIIEMARAEGITVEERPITVAEIVAGLRNATLHEAFGTGTAATIAHIQTIALGEEVFDLPALTDSSHSVHLGRKLDEIRRGAVADTRGWLVNVA
ncbi:MAG: branched-chain amino acid aminotransferase [Flavobacteriales bacterium]|nr:branched-chain amino acid aminotransferase [Flavobacteriales bacterium]